MIIFIYMIYTYFFPNSFLSIFIPLLFKFDPLGLYPTNPAAVKTIKTKELNNGRLAMLAVAGIVAQELVTGNKVF